MTRPANLITPSAPGEGTTPSSIDVITPTPTTERRMVTQGTSGKTARTLRVRVLGAGGVLSVRGTRDQKIAMIAQAQRGRVARWQLLSAGITPGMIHWMLQGGWLHRLHQGVYAVGHLAPIEGGRETAALLACQGSAVLSHLTAAGLWRICPPISPDDPIDVTVSRDSAGRREGIRFHRTRRLRAKDIRISAGLPITSPARTLLDVAELLNQRELERALDEALLQRITSKSQVEEVLARARTRRGAGRLASAVARHDTPTATRSEAEERFLALMQRAQLPLPEVNARIHGYEVDFLWRAQGVVVEVDGYKYHSSRPAFERDSVKGAKLTAAGLQVMRVTWRQMEGEPYAVVARVAQSLVRAEARRAA